MQEEYDIDKLNPRLNPYAKELNSKQGGCAEIESNPNLSGCFSRELPNEETVAAIREVQEMKANPSIGKSYSDVDQMMKEL